MALNPAIVTCTLDVWVKVADAVMVGLIHKISNAPTLYKQTYRVASDPAPTDDTDAVVAFADGGPLEISADANIDVYIKAKGSEGSVRRDL